MDTGLGSSPQSLLWGPYTNWACTLSSFPSAAAWVAVTATKQCLPLLNEQRSLRQEGTSDGVSPRESRLLLLPQALGKVGMAGREQGEGGERE